MLKAGRILTNNDILKANSPEEFVKLVRRYLGISESSLLKIDELLYLCDKLSIKESAELTGFKDQFYFTRVFTKIMNTTPGKFAGK